MMLMMPSVRIAAAWCASQFREKCRDAVLHERNETRQYSERLQHSAHVRHVFGIVALRQPDERQLAQSQKRNSLQFCERVRLRHDQHGLQAAQLSPLKSWNSLRYRNARTDHQVEPSFFGQFVDFPR